MQLDTKGASHVTLWGGAPSNDLGLHEDSFHITVNGHGSLDWYNAGLVNGSREAYRRAFDLIRADGVLYKLTASKKLTYPQIAGRRIASVSRFNDFYTYCLDRCESPFPGLVGLSMALMSPGVEEVEMRGYSHYEDMKSIPKGAHDIAGNQRLFKLIMQELTGGKRVYHYD